MSSRIYGKLTTRTRSLARTRDLSSRRTSIHFCLPPYPVRAFPLSPVRNPSLLAPTRPRANRAGGRDRYARNDFPPSFLSRPNCVVVGGRSGACMARPCIVEQNGTPGKTSPAVCYHRPIRIGPTSSRLPPFSSYREQLGDSLVDFPARSRRSSVVENELRPAPPPVDRSGRPSAHDHRYGRRRQDPARHRNRHQVPRPIFRRCAFCSARACVRSRSCASGTLCPAAG